MRKKNIILYLLLLLLIATSFFSCKGSKPIAALKKETLFTLNYGKFENELQFFADNKHKPIDTHFVMDDGFFYIAHAESAKIMELSSFGDLISIIYNPEVNPTPTFLSSINPTFEYTNNNTIAHTENILTQQVAQYPFISPTHVRVNSEKHLYISDFLPQSDYQENEEYGSLLRQLVLHFNPEGKFLDYLGQEGLGGTPFPFIKDIYTNKKNDIIVVCLVKTGQIVFWYSQSGALRYRIELPFSQLPILKEKSSDSYFTSFETSIPDSKNDILYLKIDYYRTELDESTKVNSGVFFEQTLIYPLDIETGMYDKPITIPAHEHIIDYELDREIFYQAYDLLGMSENNWFFFIISEDDGFSLLITKKDERQIIRRKLTIPLQDYLFHTFSLSKEGIISALLAKKEQAELVWWRTDKLIDSLIK